MNTDTDVRGHPAYDGMVDSDLAQLDVRLLCCRAQTLETWASGNMSAPYWRLYWNTCSGAWIELGGRRVALGPRQFMLIPPDTAYVAVLTRPVVHLYLHFQTIPSFNNRRGEVFLSPATAALLECVAEIRRLLDTGAHRGLHVTMPCLQLIHSTLSKVPREDFEQTSAHGRVAETMRHIRRELGAHLTNGDLAAIAHMNPNAYIRLFKSETGLTPQAYLTKLRVERACMMLHHTDETIDSIAEASGFCDRYHLSHTFKRLRGMGPAAFRRMRDSQQRTRGANAVAE
jgi:AraC-like DNA-binding protein